MPLINLGLGRSANPTLALAAYAVGFSVSVVFNAPVLSARVVTAGLAHSPQAYRTVARVMRRLGLILSGSAMALALLPAGEWLFRDLLGAPPDLVGPARLALLLQSPIPVLVAERGLAQGMSLLYRRTVMITLATLARLAAVTAMVLLLAVVFHLPGAAAGALSLTSGIAMEALWIRFSVRRRYGPFRRPLPAGTPPPAQALTSRRVMEFASPLVLNHTVWSLQRALINAIIARLADPVTALAAFGVVTPLFLFFSSPLFGMQATVQVLPRHRRDLRRLARFTLAVALGLSLTAGMVAWGSARWLLEAGYDLVGRPLAAALPALGWIWIHPLLMGFRAFGQGMLLRTGSTGPIAFSAAGRVLLVSMLGLGLVAGFPAGNGAIIGVSLQMAGDAWDMVLACLWGARAVRRTLRP
ncbi:MAG: hypothetical protein O7F11_09040 [Acidobacteria bacterium]|nr:hypothetical protein [Acidobacteriota bacterium]